MTVLPSAWFFHAKFACTGLLGSPVVFVARSTDLPDGVVVKIALEVEEIPPAELAADSAVTYLGARGDLDLSRLLLLQPGGPAEEGGAVD